VACAQGAEPTPAELRAAAEAFDRGREAYKEAHVAEAAGQFERADASAPSATALGLAIKARDKAGDLDRAGTLASLALERYPDDPEIQKIAPEVLGRAGAELYEARITCAEPCELADGTKIVHGVAAKRRTVFLSAGTHAIRAGFPDGRAQSKDVEATAGTSGEVTFEGPEPEVAVPSEPEPEPMVAPPPESPPEEPKKSSGLPPAVFFAGLGATVVAGGITVWSGLDTVKNPGADRVKAECAAGDKECPLYKDGQARQFRTNLLIGVTAVLGVGTGVLGAIGIDWSGGSKESPIDEAKGFHVEPWLAIGDGAAVGARGTF
jgi:hypothetical protein